MKKIVGFILTVTLLLTIFGSSCAVASSLADDWMYQIVYNAAVQAAEEAGYTNYEIIIDDDYNATINVLDAPSPTESPVEEAPVQVEEQTADSNETETEPEEKLSSEEEMALGLQELEQENIVDAMQHFLRALPSVEAEKLIAENAYDYVDELMFAEDYQNAQTFMLEHPFDSCEKFLAECNDYCFLLDLAKALNARWSINNADTSTMSDKKVREFYQQLVESETQYLDKYMSLGFSDPQLANYAYAYIGALQSQMTGVAYYGVDNEKYNENWGDHGRLVRARLIYLINKKYEIEVDSNYMDTFKDMVTEGRIQDYLFAVTESLTTQLSSVDLSFEGWKRSEWVTMEPFTLKNTSGYDVYTVIVYAVILDQNEKVIARDRIFDHYYSDGALKDGYDYQWGTSTTYSKPGLVFQEPFSSLYFECQINEITSSVEHFVKIYPLNQYAWDGKEIIINGHKTINKDEMSATLEETSSYWTDHNSSFVPCIEFILRNDGQADIKEATIECVFIDKDNNTEWSRDRYFAISSSDTPLHSSQGRSVIVYSGSGYEKKTRKVPNLVVEVYVNDKPIAKIDVAKP